LQTNKDNIISEKHAAQQFVDKKRKREMKAVQGKERERESVCRCGDTRRNKAAVFS
jgi:hypothetical protein